MSTLFLFTTIIVIFNFLFLLIWIYRQNMAKDIYKTQDSLRLVRRDNTIVSQGLELIKRQHEIDDSKRLSDIGSLAATVAHELRNPMGVIRTAVYNIRRKNFD